MSEPGEPRGAAQVRGGTRAGRPAVRCPFCGAEDAEPFALFGSQLLTEQWYCRTCRTPFERIKDDADDADLRDEHASPESAQADFAAGRPSSRDFNRRAPGAARQSPDPADDLHDPRERGSGPR